MLKLRAETRVAFKRSRYLMYLNKQKVKNKAENEKKIKIILRK